MLNINVGFGRPRVAAIVDVAPGGATVAILSAQKSAPATILCVASSPLSLEARTKTQSKGQIGEQVKEAAAQALKLYSAAGHSAPVTDVYAVVHAPWAHTLLTSMEERYETDTRISSAHISGLAEKALAACKEIDSSKLLEASVIGVELNGYPTPAPEGKYAHDLRITSVVSDCDADVRSAVEGAIHQNFPVGTISWRSGLRALMTLARETHLDRSFLMIDMGNDDTHIAAYSNGTLNQLVVEEGARTILSRISSGHSPDEVVGFLRMLARDACSSEACDVFRNAIAAAEPELVRVFGEAIGKLGSENRVPNDVLILAHPEVQTWLTGFLARIDFAQFTVTTLPLVVHTAQSLDMGHWVAGAQVSDAATVDAALVNIESRV